MRPGAEVVMNWHRRFAALFLILALSGCTQGLTGQAQAPYHPPENNGNVPVHGGGDGSGDM